MKLRIVLHTACALERVILRDELKYAEDKEKMDKTIINKIKSALNIFKESINLSLSEDEIYYIAEMILL